MFSRRVDWSIAPNRLTLALRSRRARGEELLDLTRTNPTAAALPYPLDALSAILARHAGAPYDPSPLGLVSARAAVAEHLSSCRGHKVDADDVVLTASTSEAYSFLFKLLTDPGDAVAIATPGYPLLEHLAALEHVHLRRFPLRFEKRWELDPADLSVAVDGHTRAIAVVHPNNPTGSYLLEGEQRDVAAIALRSGAAVISDEVFYDYRLAAVRVAPSMACCGDVLSFSLGGLSKSAGLPNLKLGWIVVGGPAESRRQAVEALELIADNFLSVGTPIQEALPEILALAPSIQGAIQERIEANLSLVRESVRAVPALQLLPVEGGWSAVVRTPQTQSDEELALELLETKGVLVQPGYFFDFEGNGYFVVSLLTEPAILEEGMRRVVALMGERFQSNV
jgi:alanine-synthesizing transaminase